MPISVSIVEDDEQARKVLVSWIKHAEGFLFLSDYGNAEAALDDLPQKKPDVVLMDLGLPGIKGTECIRQLKESMPKTQFVILTVYDDADHIFNALAAGATGYLLKQTQRPELLAALQYVHSGGSPMASNIARRVGQSFQEPRPPDLHAAELSDREQQVLDLLASGYLYKEIAEELGLSKHTVDIYIRRIYEKLHVRSRSQAVAKYHLPPSLQPKI